MATWSVREREGEKAVDTLCVIYNISTVHVLMRDEKEERKKQARSNKQTRQSNTAHPRQSLFLRKMSCLGMYMRDEKEERSKQDQTNNKPRQHTCNTPKAVTFPKKNELLRVGFGRYRSTS